MTPTRDHYVPLVDLIDHTVRWFAAAMKEKMCERIERHGRTWLDREPSELMARIEREYAELHENFCEEELVDLANQCMLAADRLRRIKRERDGDDS